MTQVLLIIGGKDRCVTQCGATIQLMSPFLPVLSERAMILMLSPASDDSHAFTG